MSKNNERATENELVEMYVKFWEPYAVRMAAKEVDVIERVPAWLPKIGGMTVEQVSPYEVLLLAPLYSGLQTLMDWYPEEAIPPHPDHGPFPSNEMIKNVKCPIAVIHGDKDETCLCERGRSLYELAPNKAGFTLVPGDGHCDLLARLGPVRFREVVSGLFEMVKGDR